MDLSAIFEFLGLRAIWGIIKWGFARMSGAIRTWLKRDKSTPPDTSHPQTRAAAINRLATLAPNGRHLIRNFTAETPTRDQVNIWWLEVLQIAELSILEGDVTPGDIKLLKMPSVHNFEKLLEDKSNIDWDTPERIETYHKLNTRCERLESLIERINSQ